METEVVTCVNSITITWRSLEGKHRNIAFFRYFRLAAYRSFEFTSSLLRVHYRVCKACLPSSYLSSKWAVRYFISQFEYRGLRLKIRHACRDKVCSFIASTCFGHQYAHHQEYNQSGLILRAVLTPRSPALHNPGGFPVMAT
jgi:hypothetical protein